jgi:benzylsuccinate CoA-transferase BbsE subunit
MPDSVFTGLRVLEFVDQRGEYCGKLFADMGADVIKVEPPGGGPTRRIGPFLDDQPGPDRSLFFWHYNTSKRGITLDPTLPEGRELFDLLLPTADVILETFPPGFLDELGLGYARLAEVNPRLVLTSITGFGQDGPRRDWKGSDLVHLALGGPMGVSGYSDPELPPIGGKGGQAWHMGSLWAHIGTLAALTVRDFSGRGQQVDAALHEAIAVGTELAIPNWIYAKRPMYRQTGRHAQPYFTPQLNWPTKDGRYLNVFMPGIDLPQWLTLVEWLQEEGMAEDLGEPGYLDQDFQQMMMEHIIEVIGRFIATKTLEEVFLPAQEKGFTWAAVNAPEDLLHDRHLAARAFFVEVEHPEFGACYTYPGAPYVFDKTPWAIQRRAPLVGEHNAEVYGDELGLSADQLVTYAEIGAI